MQVSNIKIFYNGQTSNQGLVRSLNFLSTLLRAAPDPKKPKRPAFEYQLTREVYQETLGNGNLYLMVV